jgi:hypothetical protein
MKMSEIISLYESVGRRIGDIFAKGTPSNCTATTFDSRILIQRQESQLRGKEVFWYSGAGAGQSRTVASFDPANNRVIHEEQYDINPDASSKYIIFDKFRTEDYESAMNRAIGKVGLGYLGEMSATMAIVATQGDYPVPSGMAFVENIRFVPSQGTDYGALTNTRNTFELPPRYWNIEGNQGGSRLIVFDPRKVNIANYDGQICRIEGQCRQDFTGTLIPSDVQEYVIAYAAMELASQKDGSEWSRRFYLLRDEIKGKSDGYNSSPGLEDLIYRQGRGRKV